MRLKSTIFRVGAVLALTAGVGLLPPRLAAAPLPSLETMTAETPPSLSPSLAHAGDPLLTAAEAATLTQGETLFWGGQTTSPLKGNRLAAVIVTLVILGCVVGAVEYRR